MKQVSYKKLWHTLIDRNLRKNDLLNATGISSSTLALQPQVPLPEALRSAGRSSDENPEADMAV